MVEWPISRFYKKAQISARVASFVFKAQVRTNKRTTKKNNFKFKKYNRTLLFITFMQTQIHMLYFFLNLESRFHPAYPLNFNISICGG